MPLTLTTLAEPDAPALWRLMDELDYETKFMMYEPGERRRDFSEVRAILACAEAGKDFFIAAQTEEKLVGYLSAQRGSCRRIAHSAYLVVGILPAYQGQGIGSAFFKKVDVWAKQNGITRLELTVMCENARALRLYKKNGFRIEGRRKNAMLVDGRYRDEYYMAKTNSALGILKQKPQPAK